MLHSTFFFLFFFVLCFVGLYLCSVEHILGNLVLQLFLGIPLELVHKGHRIGLVYIAGVLGGEYAERRRGNKIKA